MLGLGNVLERSVGRTEAVDGLPLDAAEHVGYGEMTHTR